SAPRRRPSRPRRRRRSTADNRSPLRTSPAWGRRTPRARSRPARARGGAARASEHPREGGARGVARDDRDERAALRARVASRQEEERRDRAGGEHPRAGIEDERRRVVRVLRRERALQIGAPRRARTAPRGELAANARGVVAIAPR